VGTAALNGPAADNLKDQVTALSKDNSNYRDQANQYRDQLSRTSDFAAELAPSLLSGKLIGRKVLLVALPGGADYLDGVETMLNTAGAKITARVTLQDKFFDPGNNLELLNLAEEAPQPTISATGLPKNSDGVETSAALLAQALQQRPGTPVVLNDLTALLTAYTEANDLTVDNGAVPGADSTVIISGLPAVDKDAAKKAQSVVTLTAQFAVEHPVVVAGNGVGHGNLVSAIRGDPPLAEKISTVDNVSTVQGQLVAVLATVERITTKKVGHYGLTAGASSQIPKRVS
jgi:hypothetical protein